MATRKDENANRPITGSPFNVIIVDDERGMREGCRRILAPYAATIDTATTGEEALATITPGRYDLALIDIKMPGMSGLELLTELRERDPDLVCIVITGYATLETAVDATKKGAYDFLPKPFSPEEMLSKVFKAVERRHLQVEAKRLREERERRLLEVSAEKSRLHTIINCMHDGVIVTNRDGERVLYNPAALRLLGNGPGSRTEDAAPSHSVLDNLFADVLSEGFSFDMLAREFETDDGRTIMANVAPVRDEQGEKLGAVAVLRDITELKASDRAKSQLVSLVSHELRAPLAAIEGYLGLVLDGRVADDPAEERAMLERSRLRAQALLNLIDDLLDISRIEAGQVAKAFEPLHLREVCNEILGLQRAQAASREVTVLNEIPIDLPPIRADREDMMRVFTNLITNAIKYNRKGGTVQLRGCVEGPWLRIDVADTGVGIAPAHVERIFEDFFRAKRPETREVTGTGLGLPIAKRVVESYHGSIVVTSALGEGSTFTVRLPLAARPGEQSQ